MWGDTAERSVRGVLKVLDLGIPGRRGWCCLKGGMGDGGVGQWEEGHPALERT